MQCKSPKFRKYCGNATEMSRLEYQVLNVGICSGQGDEALVTQKIGTDPRGSFH